MKLLCSGGCGLSLLIKDSTDLGRDHRTGLDYRTCRRCSMQAGARANVALAEKWLLRELAA